MKPLLVKIPKIGQAIMTDAKKQHLDMIRRTRRCRPEIQDTAAKLSHLASDDYAALVQELIQSGDDTTLGIVCNLCAVNGIRLDPKLVAETLKVIEPITDFAPLYRFQGKEAIGPLLNIALDEELSIERQVYAALIAAEMCLVHKTDEQAVLRVLRILEQDYSLSPMLEVMLADAFDLLQAGKEHDGSEMYLSQADILTLLPKERPPVVIGGGHTVQRPIPKIGRNEPCYCGSGKKYKKCCLDKEQEILRDASPYAGLTMSQVRSAPHLVDDAQIIDQMRAYELKKLVPSAMNSEQLYAAYHRADLFGLRELAFDMLLELEQRDDGFDFDKGHFVDLMESAMDAGNIALAKKIHQHVPAEMMMDSETVELQFELLQNPEHLKKLESLLRREMTRTGEFPTDSPLLRLSYGFEKTLPALSIVFARAYICANPDSALDVEVLLESVRKARAKIGIEAWDDPIEDYVEWSLHGDLEEFRDTDRSEKLNKLIKDAEAAREEARKKEKELRHKERELNGLSALLEKEKIRASHSEAGDIPQPNKPAAREKETIHRLRRRIDMLKAEISAQQEIRRDLRNELRSEREKSLKVAKIDRTLPEQVDTGTVADAQKTIRKVLVPEYSVPFCRACEIVPQPVAAKAIKAVGEFAAADDTIWRHTRPIKRIAEHYRIRIGKNYRALIHWKPDEKIKVLDLIPRKELETWIRKHC